jgi:hypothetical protein
VHPLARRALLGAALLAYVAATMLLASVPSVLYFNQFGRSLNVEELWSLNPVSSLLFAVGTAAAGFAGYRLARPSPGARSLAGSASIAWLTTGITFVAMNLERGSPILRWDSIDSAAASVVGVALALGLVPQVFAFLGIAFAAFAPAAFSVLVSRYGTGSVE